MNIILRNHHHRFAVEQMLMALLPHETIHGTDSDQSSRAKMEAVIKQKKGKSGKPKQENLLMSTLVTAEDGSKSVETLLHWKGKAYSANIPVTGEQAEEQYAIKLSLYKAVSPVLKHQPPWGALSGVRPVKLAKKYQQQGLSVENILQEKYFVDPVRAKLAEECSVISVDLEQHHGGKLAVYVDIPFCPSRCDYCSFYSEKAEDSAVESYLEALLTEIEQISPQTVHSLYVGGGTPTVLAPKQLHDLLSALKKKFSGMEEITVEAGRPETLNNEKIAVLQHHGVHRISINPQSMNDTVLESMGRAHTVEEVQTAFQLVQGKFTVNMDLIAGLHTEEDFLHSVKEVIALNPEQITVHSLTPKKNTPLKDKQASGEVTRSSAMPHSWVATMNSAWKLLEEAGFHPYYIYRQKQITQGLENVGWTRTSPCLYNVGMMEEFQNILGFGAGAVSKAVSMDKEQQTASGKQKDIQRVQNPKFPQDYAREVPSLLSKKKKIFPHL